MAVARLVVVECGGAARRRCVLLRLALALWRGQLYRLADACAHELVIY